MYYIVQWDLLPDEINILWASVEKLPEPKGSGFIDIHHFDHIYFAYSEYSKPPDVFVHKDNVDLTWSIEERTDWIFEDEKEAKNKFYELVEMDKDDLFELIFTYKKRRR